MNHDMTIHMLLVHGRTDQGPLEPAEWKRLKARIARGQELLAAWRAAQDQMDQRCSALAGRVDEQSFNRIFDEEQAKVDAALARLRALMAGNDARAEDK